MINNFSSLINTIVQYEENSLYAFLDLGEVFWAGNSEQRTIIRHGWNFKRRWFIPGLDYSDRDRIIFAPLVGLDKDGFNAEARVKARLTYHAIENARSDFRDSTLDNALCYHSALAAELDVATLFEETAAVSEGIIKDTLLYFTAGQAKHKSLWNYGFHAAPFENGIAFEWIGSDSDYDEREPKHLDSFGREVQG